jgi:hypothetical protein
MITAREDEDSDEDIVGEDGVLMFSCLVQTQFHTFLILGFLSKQE